MPALSEALFGMQLELINDVLLGLARFPLTTFSNSVPLAATCRKAMYASGKPFAASPGTMPPLIPSPRDLPES